jgi:hypothetical protein
MPNASRTTRTTTPIKFALLALGAISLSAAMASPASAQAFVSPNASDCRSAIGIAVSRGCLTAKPESYGVAPRGSNGAAGGYSAPQTSPETDALNQQRQKDAWTAATFQRDMKNAMDSEDHWQQLRVLGGGGYKYNSAAVLGAGARVPNPYNSGGNGGAAGHTGERHTLPPDRGGQSAAASPKAATPKSTTIDKATNTMTRDYRTGATTAPGGPPPAAAIGSSSKPSAEQLASQSGDRDHRRK